MSLKNRKLDKEPQEIIGVLLTNLGTPSSPTTKSVRQFLADFLSDPRVVELSSWIWKPLLHGIILRTRPYNLAKKYQKIWKGNYSPLMVNVRKQTQAIQAVLKEHPKATFKLAYAMRYGKPSINAGIQYLLDQKVTKLLVLPLYPQYASSTTGTTFDAVATSLKRWRWVPELRMVTHYFDHPHYIASLVNSIQEHFHKYGKPEKLLFSFHGLPDASRAQGDPYYQQCLATARSVADILGLREEDFDIVFQSRFGYQEWLQPYCDETIKSLAEDGIKHIAVICPGFSSDCLETLEEIAIQNKALFLKNRGRHFHYIPALNYREDHIQALVEIIQENCAGWGA